MGYHWETLGLEPTGDALAIKKAYAGLLKKNRPDEQPEAYQALRQAYEWALSEAEWIRQAPQDADQDEENAPLPELLHSEDAQAAPPAEVLEPLGDFSFESDRADALLDRWSERLLQCESQQVEMCWQALSHELDSLPLDEQTAVSVMFADFVLQHETLPSALLVNMARYFRWGRDYRDAERLGAFRLAQLRERLVQEAPTTFRDAQQIERAIELLRLDWVLEHQGKLSGWIYAALARPDLRRLMADTDDKQRRALDISFVRWEAIGTATLQAVFVRLLFVLACAIPVAYLLMEPGQDLSNWMAASGFFGAGYWLLAWLVARQLPSAEYVQARLSALSWMRSDSNRLVAAVALPLVVALIARDDVALPALQSVFPDWGLTGAALLICLLAPLAWTENLETREIYLPMLGSFAFALTSLTGGDGADWLVAMGAAAAWMSLGGWVYQQYHHQVIHYYSNPWAALRPRAWWGWLLLVVAIKYALAALAFLLMLALPITLRVIARYMSTNTALLAIGLAIALAMLAEPGKAAGASLLALVLSAAALTWLQALADWASRKLFSRVPASFFQDDD